MNEAVVEFRNVTYAPPGSQQAVLWRLNLEVRQGETLVLLGESGCGKTTTLRLINRMLDPSDGEVVVQGKSTRSWDPMQLRRQSGYVIQDGGLFPHFSVERNVGLVPSLEQWDSTRIHNRVHELLQLVGLEPATFARRYPRELSGGQRQRVSVARALAADPPLLLLDEPFGALDPLTRSRLQQEFKQLCARLHKTVVFVTHDVREALLLGSRIALMREGGVALLETPEGFLRSKDAAVQSYLETLRLPAQTTSESEAPPTVAPEELPVPDGNPPQRRSSDRGGRRRR